MTDIGSLPWPKCHKPGERVLILAAQGFRGVGRYTAEKRCLDLAEGWQDYNGDEVAMQILHGFRWNELADLPFPIRDVLGIDEDGRFADDVQREMRAET
jgi:hypothetical protein